MCRYINNVFYFIEPISRRYSHHQYDDEYPGICFLGNPLKYEVGTEGADISPPELGISLKVPPDAVLPEDTVNVTIRPCLSGPFHYPDGSDPFSAVYLIAADSSFKKKVELRLQHYGQLETEEQASQMTFLSAHTSLVMIEGKEMFKFEAIKRGKFAMCKDHGTLELKHFCLTGVGGTINSDTRKQVMYTYCMKPPNIKAPKCSFIFQGQRSQALTGLATAHCEHRWG